MRSLSRALLIAGLAAAAWVGVQAAEHAAARADDNAEYAVTQTADAGGQLAGVLGSDFGGIVDNAEVIEAAEVVEQPDAPVEPEPEQPGPVDEAKEPDPVNEVVEPVVEVVIPAPPVEQPPAAQPAPVPDVVEPTAPVAEPVAPTTNSEADPPVSASGSVAGTEYIDDPERPCDQPRSSSLQDDDAYVPPNTNHGHRPRKHKRKTAPAPVRPNPPPCSPGVDLVNSTAVGGCAGHRASDDSTTPDERPDTYLRASAFARHQVQATLARTNGISPAPA